MEEKVPWGSFQDELDWCTEQLQTDLLTETNTQEVEGREKLLSFLQSKGAPSARKRQVMQMVFGDYRHRMTNEQKPPEQMGETDSQRNREGTFAWIPSNNSFNFNFFPDGNAAPACAAAEETSRPVVAPLTEDGSGFAFNFQIPEEKPHETVCEPSESVGPLAAPGDRGACGDGGCDQTSVCLPHKGKKKKKGNRKKNSAGASDHGKKPSVESSGSAASHAAETETQSAELQLARELDWCAEQLELGLRTQKSSPKQTEEASRALRTLRSHKAPLAKKRQVMRGMFGDYRKKMEEDKARQAKLIHAAAKSARITAVSEPAKKPVFHRRAKCSVQVQSQKPGSPSQEQRPGPSTENCVFAPTQQEFCFNFF